MIAKKNILLVSLKHIYSILVAVFICLLTFRYVRCLNPTTNVLMLLCFKDVIWCIFWSNYVGLYKHEQVLCEPNAKCFVCCNKPFLCRKSVISIRTWICSPCIRFRHFLTFCCCCCCCCCLYFSSSKAQSIIWFFFYSPP